MARYYASMCDRLIANSVLERTSEHVEEPCWIWIGKRSKAGRPHINVVEAGKHRTRKAYHVSFEEFRGRKIRAGYECAHLCDNPACINPAHLAEQKHATNCRYKYK